MQNEDKMSTQRETKSYPTIQM